MAITPKVRSLFGLIKDSDGILGVGQRTRVTLTPTQVKALFTTPQTLVSAPGAGKVIIVDEVSGIVNFSTTQYTGANAVEIRYTNAAGAKATSDLAAAWLNSATTRVDNAPSAAVTAVANAPIVVAVPTANPGAGDSTVILDIKYRIISLT